MAFKKPTSKIQVNPPKQVKQVIAKAKGRPWVVLGVVALVPLVIMLAFTMKGGSSFTRSRKAANVDVIVAGQTPQEIAEEATLALRKGDTDAFF